ncbi:MAG: hypothetical protein RMK43_05740 [Cyclobacteriaceae bacterium]|nr:hypothetical protein [Cyclobacteriaceae bacterium]
MRTVMTSRSPVRLKKKLLDQRQTELWFTIVPPPHIRSDVSVLRDDIHYLMGHGFEGQRSMPLVSLFRYTGEYGHDLMDLVENRAKKWEPFNVFLKDFGYSVQGDRRSIYIDLVNRYAITELVEHLTGFSENIWPVLPLARNLSSGDFLKCWPYLKALNYGNQHFPCTEITVFKRENGKWIKERIISLGAE